MGHSVIFPIQPGATPRNRSFFIVAVLLLLAVAAQAQYSAPRIFFSDLQSGPNTGGQNNLGAIVTIYGQGFGPAQNTSTVTVGGAAVGEYLAWSDSKVSFQPGPAASSGNIMITVDGKASNSLPFTIRGGNIYFVSPDGNDADSGSYSSPWLTLVKATNTMSAGDIAYALDGVTQNGPDSGAASLDVTNGGTPDLPLAIVAYPGAQVTVGSASSQVYGIRATASQWVIAGLTVSGSTSALSLVNTAGWRVVGNNFSCPDGFGMASCVGGYSLSNLALLGNNIHDNGSTSSADVEPYDSVAFTGPSHSLEVGWNQIVRTRSCRALRFSSASAGQYLLKVHDNFIQGAVCSGISFANVNPSLGAVTAYNNVIADVGTGPAPGGVEADTYACIGIAGEAQGEVILASNTMYDCGARANGDSGAFAASASVTLIDNLIDVLSGESYFSANSVTAAITGSNNLLYGAGSPPAFLSSSVTGNPDFVAPANSNFRVKANSPAIDAGEADLATWDADGVPRPQGLAYDIGAYEYSGPALGEILTSPATVSFGNVDLGSTSTQTITIANIGAGSTTVSEIFANPYFISKGLTLPLTLAPGQSATFTVTFSPSLAGTVSTTESLTSDASNSPTALQFSGTGVNPPGQLTATPSALSFGNVAIGASAVQKVTVTAHTASVTISGTDLSGTGFSWSGPTLPLTLAAGMSASFTVEFTPLAAGSVTGTLSLVSNAATAPAVSLSGTGIAGRLAATPATLSLGNVNLGSSSSSQTAVVTASTASVTIARAILTGPGFSLQGPALPLTLAAGQHASFAIKFAPLASGKATGSLSLVSNATNALTVAMTGTGVAGKLTANPAALNYGNVNLGSSGTKNLTVTASTASVTITQSVLTGTAFSLTGPTLPLTLTAGQSATFSIQFTPVAAGSVSGALSLVSNAANKTLIALSGTGIAGQLSAASTTLSFNNVPPGGSDSQNLTVTASTASVTITQSVLTGTGFSVTGPALPLTLAAGQTATFTIVFKPLDPTPVTGSFSLVSNASDANLMVTLSGTGTGTGTGMATGHSVALVWDPSASRDTVGYYVYRGTQDGGPYTQITPVAVTAASYRDASVVAGNTYYYVVTAVSSTGRQSAFSPETVATIPTP